MRRSQKTDHVSRGEEPIHSLLLAFFMLACGCATTEQSSDAQPDRDQQTSFRGMARGGMGGDGPMGGEMSAGMGRGSMKGDGRGEMRGGRGDGPERKLDDVWVDRGIQYASLDGRALTMDIIQPRTPPKKPLPVIVYLDTATDGPAGSARQLVRFAASGNYVCAKVKCHNFVDIAHPADNPQCAEAVRWLASKEIEYGINSGRIGVWVAFSEADFVCTLERNSTNVLASSTLARRESDVPVGPPPMTDDLLVFFDKNLRGENAKPPPMVQRGRGGGGGGGRGGTF